MTELLKQMVDALRHIENAATDPRVQRYEIRAAATEALAKFDAQAAEQAAPVQQVGELAAEQRDAQEAPFEAWWDKHGQFHRAGGGAYEKTFAWHAWCAALSTRPELRDAEIDALRNRVRVAEETSARCREVLDAAAASWREDVGQIEALRRDAERYRAVRDDDCHPYGICIWDEDDGWAQDARRPDVVDAAIDAALAARGEKR